MQIVGAYACSHAGLLMSRKENAPPAQRDAIFGAFETMGAEIRALAPDAVVLIGTDHLRVYPLTAVPQFTIGVSETAQGIGDAEMPKVTVPVHQSFARTILDGALAEDVDLAFSEAMQIDHSFVTPLLMAFGEELPAIVPIAQNCNVPPLPALRRSYDVGRKIGGAIETGPDGRVVVIGTGGLSHWVGNIEQQQFMRQPAGSRIARGKSPLVLDETGPINESFDRAFLRTICRCETIEFLREWTTERLYDEAGNGAQEIRNWLLVAGVMADQPAEILAYEPVKEWLTGTAVLKFHVA